MKPFILSSKIFIDGGDAKETAEADKVLKAAGHVGVEGQTTNPSLIMKSVELKMKNEKDQKISEKEAVEYYRKTVMEMAKITKGPISIQVIGDPATLTAEDMLTQARDRILWIPNGVIKFPCTEAGLEAAEVFCQEGPVNITLNFSQEQAAAVHAATRTHNYDVFVSPFVGRLDDRGEKGMDVVANIVEMYKKLGDGHVKVLTASVRTVEHIKFALWLKSDVITIPFKLLKEWAAQGFPQPASDYQYNASGLTEIPYKELSLDLDWREYNLSHDLTTSGLDKFWEDWSSLVSN